MIELLAAFVTPNQPLVREVISKARKFLQKWIGNLSFAAYESGNPNIVKL